MEECKYKGVVVPMITPFGKWQNVDRFAVRRIIETFVEHGVSPLLAGTTGEGTSFSFMQYYDLAHEAAWVAKERVKSYACLNSVGLRDQLELADEYRKLKVDVVVATLPGYYALTDEQIYSYYKTLADKIKLPLMLYNIKATTHISIPVEVVKRLSEHPNIVGLKDSERDLERMEACLQLSKGNPDFSYFCGWAAQSANSLLKGADGIVPSTGNFRPDLFVQLYNAATSGNAKEALRLQQETDEIARIYQEGRTLGESLAALKVMMSTKGLCRNIMIPPLTALSEEEELKIKAIARKYR